MSLVEGLFFGLLQGLTEFLPVSSSGHLAVLKELFALSELPVIFDILLHVASLAAVTIVFRRRIAALFTSLFRYLGRRSGPEDRENLVYIAAILVGTVLTAGIGFTIQALFPAFSIKMVSAFFLLTAFVLFAGFLLGRYHGRKNAGRESRSIRVRDGIYIGIAQGIGVFPGISRSGITISSALAVGLAREQAGELSFLLSIPAILGALILELKDADALMAQVDLVPLIVGIMAAFVSGYVALRLLLRIVRKGSLVWFSLWLIPLGVYGLLFL